MAKALIVSIIGDARQFGAELDKAAGKTRQMGKVAGVAGLAIAGGLAIGLDKSVKAAVAAQTETARLGAAYQAVGLNIDNYKGSIDKAETSSRSLGFTNEDVRNSLGSLIVATHNQGKAVKDLGVAQDLARFKGLSLSDATKTLTTAMAGSQRAAKQLGIIIPSVTTNYDKLKASGIDLTTHTGHLAEAHAKLLDKMATGQAVIARTSELVHGQAQAFSQTAQGGLAQMHAQLGALEENLGSALLPILVSISSKLAAFTGFLAKHTTIAKIAVIAIGALAVALLAASIATSIMTAATLAFDIAAAPITVPLLAIVAALAVLGVAIYEIVKHWGAITAFFRRVWNDIKQLFDEGINFVRDHWKTFVFALVTIMTGGIGGIVVYLATHWGQIKADAVAAFNAVKNAIVSAWNTINNKVNDGINAVVKQVKALPGEIVAAIGDLSKLLYNAGVSLIKGLWDGIKHELTGLLNDVKGIGGKIKSLKGPIETDRVLLIPAGEAIIQGLQAGMEAALPGVYNLAAGIAPRIQASSTSSATAAGGGGQGGPLIGSLVVHGTADAGFARLIAAELATQLRGGRTPQLQQAIKAL